MIPEDIKKRKQGGRPAAHSLVVTQEEYDWAAKKFSRKAELVPTVKRASAKLKEGILSINDKLANPADLTSKDGVMAVKLSRDELQVLIEMLHHEQDALANKILPEYARRAPDSPRFQEAKDRYTLLSKLKAKAEGIFNAGSHRIGNKPSKV